MNRAHAQVSTSYTTAPVDPAKGRDALAGLCFNLDDWQVHMKGLCGWAIGNRFVRLRSFDEDVDDEK